jgi:LuxR family maltose regulon positive regulatory protein
MIERAIQTVQEPSLTVMRRLLLAERADLLVALRRLEDAERWAREHRVGEVLDFGLPGERECLSLARLRLARGEVAEAVNLLGRLRSPAEAAGRCGVLIEILALQALALHQGGKLQQALSSIEKALVLAEPEGYIRTFADHGEPMGVLLRQLAGRGFAPQYIARILTAIVSPGRSAGRPAAGPAPKKENEAPATPDGTKPLTARELEVIRLLAGGASNQRIANELTVSVGTVKAHISHILGKMEAGNRTEAVARARKLGLLD